MPSPRLDKRLGQHHLRSPDLCLPLVRWLRPAAARVVEIGPGGGVLTEALLAAGAERVAAIELDREWLFDLRERMAGRSRVDLVLGDALDLAWGSARSPRLVAGNLPYNVATPILGRLIVDARVVPRAAFLVQWEVGQRLTARPGTREWGPLTLLAKSYSVATLIARVRAGSFRPAPRVDGAFIGLELREPPLPRPEMRPFLEWTRALLGLRRKTLGNVLRRLWGRVAADRALGVTGLDARLRAETLDLEVLLTLYREAPPAAARVGE